MARRPPLRRAGRTPARHSAPHHGPLGRVPPPRGRLHVRGVRTGTHAQSRRALQPRNQVRRLHEGGLPPGGRLRRHGPLLPQGGGAAAGRRHDVAAACGQRPGQGPELLPLPALAGAAAPGALPRGRAAQVRGAAHRRRAGARHRQAQGFAGHLLRGQGRPAALPPAEAGRTAGQRPRDSRHVAQICAAAANARTRLRTHDRAAGRTGRAVALHRARRQENRRAQRRPLLHNWPAQGLSLIHI